MANKSGTNYTKIAAGGSGTNVVDRGEFGGTVKSVYDTVTFAATGDVGYVATPPKGSKIIGFLFASADLGTGSTVSIGDLASATRYASSIDCGTAAVSGNTAMLAAGMNYEIGTATDDDQIILTAGGSVTAGAVKICILYV
jgi:hypothetical protein